MRKLTMLQASRRHLPSAAVFVVGWIIAIEGGCWGLRRWAEARLPAAAANAPNVLLIVIDTLRADYLSCQGYGRPTSPNLDAFASEGALFENCYSAASWTPPSHASLLTGQPTNVHKADTQPLDGRLPTLAEVMSHNGYRSAAFSANEGFFTARRRFDRGFQRFDDEFWNWNEWLTGTVYGNSWIRPVLNSLFGANDDYGRVRGPQISDAYLRWLAGGKGRPSFAVLNYMDVHDPYNAPPPFRSRFGGERLPTLTGAERWVWQRTEEERQTRRNNYASCAAYADDCVGRLLRALDERGLASNTLVIITSDHGEMLGEHNLFRHGASLYPEVLHVPLIMRWPGHVPAAKRLQTVVSNRAIASTIVALTGMEAGSPFVDPPLSRLWQDPAAAAASRQIY